MYGSIFMHDTLQQVIFYIFAGITIFSAFLVVSQNNPVRCVLFLVLAFLSSAVLWILVYAEFLALILVLVYVGAVMTLFLFVVMMLNIDIEAAKMEVYKRLPLGLIVIAVLSSLLYTAVPKNYFNSSMVERVNLNNYSSEPLHTHENSSELAISNTEELGMVLYTDYLLAFELAAVILLAAIVASITLAHRKAVNSKQQNIVKQIMTPKEDRVRLVD